MFNLYYYSYLFSDPYYLLGTIFVVIAIIIGLSAQFKINAAYHKYRSINNHRHMTGYDIARSILDSHQLSFIQVKCIQGKMSDHYNSSNDTVYLSDEVYNNPSIASIAIAAHECGHVLQYHEGYTPLKIRNSIVPICNIGQYLGWFALFIGLFLGHSKIAWFGFILMLSILAFQLLTLPVEFDASKRALVLLQDNFIDSDEVEMSQKMLSAAAMTYVAGLLQTLASLLRTFLLILSRSRDD